MLGSRSLVVRGALPWSQLHSLLATNSPGSSPLGRAHPLIPSMEHPWAHGQARLPAQLGPALELVPLRFCGVLPWRLGTPQLRL